jgi:uncharacterized membrane protein
VSNLDKQHGQRPLIQAGIVLGIGFGGFFDGIIFHQILQWHHMLSVPYPVTDLKNLELNTLADGLFHTFTYVLTGIGFFLLWRAVERKHLTVPGRLMLGCLLVGWGLFNDVEGFINHILLQIHHVRSGPDQAFWDVAFLVWGGLMLVGGWSIIRAERRKKGDLTHAGRP